MDKYKSLADLSSGEECVITKVHGYGGFRNRIMEIGFVNGVVVNIIKNAPLSDPIEYEIMGTHISLRRSEAKLIEVHNCSHNNCCDSNCRDMQEGRCCSSSFHGTIDNIECESKTHIMNMSKRISVALVGNPNCGKTSLFNKITGLKEKVGNYSGVTVGAKESIIKYKGYEITIVDLPGTYSINDYSPEEVYVRKYITERHPDIVLNVVNAPNMERNMLVTTQLIDMNIRMVMALNVYDEFLASGDTINLIDLSTLLGFDIVPTIASKGKGVDELLDAVIDAFEGKSFFERHIHINYGVDVERAISNINKILNRSATLKANYHARYIAIKLLTKQSFIDEIALVADDVDIKMLKDITAKEVSSLEKAYKQDTDEIITSKRYGFINGALKETLSKNEDSRKESLSTAIDTILTNKWLGIPLLVFFIWVMFEVTFTLGSYPMEWIESGVALFSNWLEAFIPDGEIKSLVIDGIVAGVGSVLVFLPNIIILFTFISIFEDSGYMSRASFIMDKMMHKMGLHGKSFIPLLMGFGCSVPAIMATRTLESRKDRILTILMIPFMSCSAKLPIYLLFVSAFFERYQALILLSLYAIGILVGILGSYFTKKIMFRNEDVPFVMELPPYRVPSVRNVLSHMWTSASQYLKKIASVIFIASIILWALSYYPKNENAKTRYQQLESSYIGMVGHAIEPIVEPLGFDWKMGVCLVTGLSAKEVIVSTIGILYTDADTDVEGDDVVTISDNLNSAEYASGVNVGSKVFTPLVAYTFLLFTLLYVPCLATVGVVAKELNKKWALFVTLYTTGLAWIVSFAIYQIGNLF